jgi:hypothetical protein
MEDCHHFYLSENLEGEKCYGIGQQVVKAARAYPENQRQRN